MPIWQHALRDAVTRLGTLLDLLELTPEQVDLSADAARSFPLRVPRSFVARMRVGDPRDPLLLQVLPASSEVVDVAGFGSDPLAEADVGRGRGVLQKFHGRVLLVTTGACAVHCRYCFRRHFPYAEHQASGDDFDQALALVTSDASIAEVILSGGDPLVVRDDRLAAFATRLAELPHVRTLRVHTRLPIVIPERVDDALLRWLAGGRLRPVMVVHANHAREIDDEVGRALSRLRSQGVTVLNQAVLLRGVNDDVSALCSLSETLFDHGVLPYYLHLLDRVAGSSAFEVDDERAVALHGGMQAALPGYLVPKLVREVPGAPSKVSWPPGPQR